MTLCSRIKSHVMTIHYVLLVIATALLTLPAAAQTLNRQQALEISQAAHGNAISDLQLVDHHGQTVKLSDYRGKPLVISLIYTSCYYICPTTTQHLATVVRKANAALDEGRFQVLTIGFDTVNDTPDAMRAFAKSQSIELDDWAFLSADQATIDQLAKELGFVYVPSPHGFDHMIQASVIDSNGRVFRQVYGMEFDTPHLVEPLKELVFGEPGSTSLLTQVTTKIRFFCTVYDPASDRYRYDYSVVMGFVIGLLCIATFGYFLAREWLRALRTH